MATNGNPDGAGYFNLVDNGGVREQYVLDPAIDSAVPYGVVLSSGLSYLGQQQIDSGGVAVVTTQGLVQVLVDADSTEGDALIVSPDTAGFAQSAASPSTQVIGLCLESVTVTDGSALCWAYVSPNFGAASGGGGGGDSVLSGVLGSDSTIGSGLDLFAGTVLAEGTWLLTITWTAVWTQDGLIVVELQKTTGATTTYGGPVSSNLDLTTDDPGPNTVSMTTLATVGTGGATFKWHAFSGPSGGGNTMKATDSIFNGAVTGFTAVKVA